MRQKQRNGKVGLLKENTNFLEMNKVWNNCVIPNLKSEGLRKLYKISKIFEMAIT